MSLWFGTIMVLVVVAGALVFSFTDFYDDRLYGSKRTIFIVVLFAYALYRGWRTYLLFKQKKDEE
jgi:hypothetical protein